MFSSTLRSGSSFTCWKVRARPSAATRRGGKCLAGAPNRRMCPELGGSTPLTTLNSVVLPAPFGPISATISLACTVKLTSRFAARPPKLREIASSASSSSPGAVVAAGDGR